MRKLLVPLSFLALVACAPEGSDAVLEYNGSETDQAATAALSPELYFGDTITEADAISGSELLAQLDGKNEMEAKVSARINKCCRKKGCWMTVDLGEDQEMMVRFKDYGFFVPKDADGSTAIFTGKAFLDTMSVETLRHMAEDAGKTEEEIAEINAPEVKVAFEADGVIIKDYHRPTPEVEEAEKESAQVQQVLN